MRDSDRDTSWNLPLRRRRVLSSGLGFVGASFLPWPGKGADISRLRIGVSDPLETINPRQWISRESEWLSEAIFLRLVRFAPGSRWQTVPYAAAESPVFSEDGRTVSFVIRDDLRFGDGRPITAEDVAKSYNYYLEEDASVPYRYLWRNFEEASATSKLTGVIKLREPDRSFVDLVLSSASASILPDGEFFDEKGFNTDAYSGPYLPAEIVPFERMLLLSNDNFRTSQRHFKEIDVLTFPEREVMGKLLQLGDLDWFQSDSANEVLRHSGANIELRSHPALTFIWCGFSSTGGPLQDGNVRAALSAAINVQKAAKAAYGDDAHFMDGYLPREFPGGSFSSRFSIRGEATKAKELLAQAGYSSGMKVGLSFPKNESLQRAAESIAEDLREIGVDVELKQLGYLEIINAWMSSKSLSEEGGLLLGRSRALPNPLSILLPFTEASIWSQYLGIKTDRLQDVYNSAKGEGDANLVDELLIKFQQILDDTAQVRFIARETRISSFKSSIEPKSRPDGMPILDLFETHFS